MLALRLGYSSFGPRHQPVPEDPCLPGGPGAEETGLDVLPGAATRAAAQHITTLL